MTPTDQDPRYDYLTAGPWRKGDEHRALPNEEWRTYPDGNADDKNLIEHWNCGQTERFQVRRLKPALASTWTRSTDRMPTQAECPIIVRYRGLDLVCKVPQLTLSSHLWTRFIEPAAPPPTQAELDEQWIRNYTHGFSEAALGVIRDAMAYARSTPKT